MRAPCAQHCAVLFRHKPVLAPLFTDVSHVMLPSPHSSAVYVYPAGTPDPGTYFNLIDQHKVKALFTAPTALRAIKKEDPEVRTNEWMRDEA